MDQHHSDHFFSFFRYFSEIKMYHRMYLRRCSMSSISEESETGDDEQMLGQKENTNQLPNNLNVEHCLGHLNNFKQVTLVFFLFPRCFCCSSNKIVIFLFERYVYSNVSSIDECIIHLVLEPFRASDLECLASF